FRSFSSRTATQEERVAVAEAGLDGLREHDPNFSPVLFTDFTYALYAAVQEARGRKGLAMYSPYLSPDATRALEALGPPGLTRVSGVIVAASRVVNVPRTDSKRVTVVVEFETNYTETTGPGSEAARYCKEQWRFVRGRDVLSKPPGQVT